MILRILKNKGSYIEINSYLTSEARNTVPKRKRPSDAGCKDQTYHSKRSLIKINFFEKENLPYSVSTVLQ